MSGFNFCNGCDFKKCKCGDKRGYCGPTDITVLPNPISTADFFALMPGDNPATVALGGYVDFPQDGVFVGTDITRDGNSPESFKLGPIGVYQVLFQVSVTEAGQLQLELNGSPIPNSVVGRATGTSQIVGISLIRTTTVNNILRIQNPSGNSTALTITRTAGGASSVSAHVVITLLSRN